MWINMPWLMRLSQVLNLEQGVLPDSKNDTALPALYCGLAPIPDPQTYI